MRRHVVFGDGAANDLADIFLWIEGDAGTVTASRYVARIIDYCEKLADFPLRGIARDDLKLGLRLLGFERRATIAFSVTGDEVAVLRVLHRGRDVEGAFHYEDL